MSADIQENAIEIQDVWKIFGDRWQEALDDVRTNARSKNEILEKYNCVVGVSNVSFNIKRGEIFCVMGLSGSGKSTLVRHINRLLEPSAGRIMVNGQDVMAIDQESLRKFRNEHIAMVFQNFALMPHRSVIDNVAMPLEIRGVSKNQRTEIAENTLAMVELKGWGNKFAHELSGGMQQRVGLARALAADPEVLLMDEPFSALDPLIRRQLQNEFMQLAKGMNKTTVFITHDLDEAVRIGHRIAIMKDGKVVQVGTPEQIVMNPADDYVADFVAGISRLKVVRAHAVMTPIADFTTLHGAISDDAPTFNEDANLSMLIEQAIGSESPLIIQDSNGTRVGVITRADLLQTVIEGTETS
ncbi:MAG: betaine/proline/choline family ABC transporter ATP-binding protein [Gammaproteobacteria bacterium]|nr:betaine/proline/choline family ABC transporter ATP-binding protein [Gammaproteobacteria bacterium]